jgi:hypothetical protein
MSLELRPVGSTEQLLQTVAAFNRDAREHPSRTRTTDHGWSHAGTAGLDKVIMAARRHFNG